jgi:hypothetical protein
MTNCPTCGYNGVDGDQCPYCGNQDETDVNMDFPFPEELLSTSMKKPKWKCPFCLTGSIDMLHSCPSCGNNDKSLFPLLNQKDFEKIVNNKKIHYSLQMFARTFGFQSLFEYAFDVDTFLKEIREEFSKDDFKLLKTSLHISLKEFGLKEESTDYLVPILFGFTNYWLPKINKVKEIAKKEGKFLAEKIEYDKKKIHKDIIDEMGYITEEEYEFYEFQVIWHQASQADYIDVKTFEDAGKASAQHIIRAHNIWASKNEENKEDSID